MEKPQQHRARCQRRGFTLLETALALVIVGAGVCGMMELLAAGSQANLAGSELSVGSNLRKNIREIANGLAFQDPNNPTSPNTNRNNLAAANDIWDLDGLVLSPPVDCTGNAIAGYPGWTQKVAVQTVSPGDLTSVRPQDPTVPTAMITVTVLHGNQTVYSTQWIVCLSK